MAIDWGKMAVWTAGAYLAYSYFLKPGAASTGVTMSVPGGPGVQYGGATDYNTINDPSRRQQPTGGGAVSIGDRAVRGVVHDLRTKGPSSTPSVGTVKTDGPSHATPTGSTADYIGAAGQPRLSGSRIGGAIDARSRTRMS